MIRGSFCPHIGVPAEHWIHGLSARLRPGVRRRWRDAATERAL